MYKPCIEVVFGNERIISPSGLNIVGAMLGKSDFKKRCDRRKVDPKRSQPQIKDGDILLTYIGLLTLGKTSYDSVHEFDDDPDYFQNALGIAREIPSAETIRQRMDDIGDSLRPNLLDANVDMFVAHGITPGALPGGEVPVDIDVTPFDNSKTMKEGVSRTYKGFDGFAPIVSYIGTEGFMADIELREGKQHCQEHTPEFLKETLSISHRVTDKPLLIRMDSGNDAAENLGILIEDGSWFIVKRNPRRESKEGWLNELKGCCKDIRHPRLGKDVYVGTTWKDITYKTGTEPLCVEDVMNIVELEQPDGVIAILGGQNAINLAEPLRERGVKIIGTDCDAIERAENRDAFEKLLLSLHIPQPMLTSLDIVRMLLDVLEEITLGIATIDSE